MDSSDKTIIFRDSIDRLVQDCSNSSALAAELLLSGTKTSIYDFWLRQGLPMQKIIANAPTVIVSTLSNCGAKPMYMAYECYCH